MNKVCNVLIRSAELGFAFLIGSVTMCQYDKFRELEKSYTEQSLEVDRLRLELKEEHQRNEHLMDMLGNYLNFHRF